MMTRYWLPALVLPLVVVPTAVPVPLLNLMRTCWSLLTKVVVVVTAAVPRRPSEIGTLLLPPMDVEMLVVALVAASSTTAAVVESPRLDLARSMDDFVGFKWLFCGRDLAPIAEEVVVAVVSMGV